MDHQDDAGHPDAARPRRKLSVARETLRRLGVAAMGRAAGGTGYTEGDACYTQGACSTGCSQGECTTGCSQTECTGCCSQTDCTICCETFNCPSNEGTCSPTCGASCVPCA